MTSIVNIADHRAKLTLSGKLTYEENESFRESLSALEEHEAQEIMIDISNLEFVDSAGLGMLLLLRDRMPQNCRIGLSGANAQVRKILTLTRLDQMFMLI